MMCVGVMGCDGCRLVILHFWASWSQPCQQMLEAMVDLAKDCPDVKFYKVRDPMHSASLNKVGTDPRGHATLINATVFAVIQAPP